MINPYLLVFAYGLTIVASSMAGGYLAWGFRIDHVRMQFVLSFVGGMMLGVAMLMLLPHGFLAIHHGLASEANLREVLESQLPRSWRPNDV